MPDKSAENLARIRACDADWNENDHPRADNGQFTSGGGGGVKISKFKGQSGKVKAEREAAYREQVETGNKINALNRQLESSPEYRRANRNASLGTGQTRINGVEERARLKKEADKELDPLREQWRNAYAKQRSLAHRVGGKFTTKEKSINEAVKKYGQQMTSAMKAAQNADNEAAREQAENEYSDAMGKQMGEIYNATKKEHAAMQTLAKARPKIAAMRKLAQAANPANVKNIKTLLSGPSSMNELFQKYKSDNNLDDASTVLELSSQMRMNGGDLFKAISEVRSKFDEMNDNGWMDDDAYERNIKSLDRVSGEAWSALEREKRIARGNKIGVRVKKYSDKTKGLSEKHAAEQKKQAEKINKAIHKSAMAEGYEKQKRADNAVYREQGKLINMQKLKDKKWARLKKKLRNIMQQNPLWQRHGLGSRLCARWPRLRRLLKLTMGNKNEIYAVAIKAFG